MGDYRITQMEIQETTSADTIIGHLYNRAGTLTRLLYKGGKVVCACLYSFVRPNSVVPTSVDNGFT